MIGCLIEIWVVSNRFEAQFFGKKNKRLRSVIQKGLTFILVFTDMVAA